AHGSASRLTHASVALTHTATGKATLNWNATTKALTVTLRLTGLAPNSTHPAHIHLGTCNSDGPIAYMLHNVKASKAGIGTSTTLLHNVKAGIPASGWYINVHNGPG